MGLEYDEKKKDYMITDDDREKWNELERKNGFYILSSLVDDFCFENKCDFPWLDGETIEHLLDEYIEYIRGSDYYAEQYDYMNNIIKKEIGIELF